MLIVDHVAVDGASRPRAARSGAKRALSAYYDERMKLGMVVLVAALAVACSTTNESSTPALPACTWSANLNPPETGYTWSVGRALVQCTGDCVTEVCVSDDPTSCPGDNGVGGSSTCTPSAGAPGTCVDTCKPDEYGFFASTLGCTTPTSGPNLPSRCYVPVGVAVSLEGAPMCCPCE